MGSGCSRPVPEGFHWWYSEPAKYGFDGPGLREKELFYCTLLMDLSYIYNEIYIYKHIYYEIYIYLL